MGKPTAKILICGAARIITPKAKLTSRIAATAGRDKQRTLERFTNPVPLHCKFSGMETGPTGNKVCFRQWSRSTRGVHLARPPSRESKILTHDWDLDPVLRIDRGSKPRPMLVAIVWPATTMAPNTICKIKPIATPTTMNSVIIIPSPRTLEFQVKQE